MRKDEKHISRISGRQLQLRNLKTSGTETCDDGEVQIENLRNHVPVFQHAPAMGCWRCSRSRSRTPPAAASLGRFDANNVTTSDSAESSSSESDSASVSQGNRGAPRVAQLTLSHLASLRASASKPEADQQRCFSENGIKKSRIKMVLSGRKASGCQCDKQLLWQNVDEDFSLIYWDLPLLIDSWANFCTKHAWS